MNSLNQFFANGKVLLTGEYFIIDGAPGIALPCQLGQTLQVLPHHRGTIHWRSYNVDKKLWLETTINSHTWNIVHTNNDSAAIRLLQVLKASQSLGSKIDLTAGHNVRTHLEFDRSWGLGSSSTLLSLVAQWTSVDPFQLSAMTFGGSGYDIACATGENTLLYQLINGAPIVKSLDFDPLFKEQLCFVHLGKKQDTQDAIELYSKLEIKDKVDIQNRIAHINNQILSANDIDPFLQAIDDHENLIANAIGLEKIKDQKFKDFNGSVKSLGAWGGDFVLAASKKDISRTITYFQSKGYETIVLWEHMVL